MKSPRCHCGRSDCIPIFVRAVRMISSSTGVIAIGRTFRFFGSVLGTTITSLVTLQPGHLLRRCLPEPSHGRQLMMTQLVISRAAKRPLAPSSIGSGYFAGPRIACPLFGRNQRQQNLRWMLTVVVNGIDGD